MIYCVEDDNSLRELTVYSLSCLGFKAQGFDTGVKFFEALEEETPQLIILDIMLPDADGVAILKRLRNNPATADIPVILATGMGSECDRVDGLNAGADDYLVKPFGVMEMVSRVKAVLRRCQPCEQRRDCFTVGAISLNVADHVATLNGESIPLTLKEFELLRCFMENEGKAFSREELLTRVWDMELGGETRTVDVHIGTLRTKLGECGSYVQTVRGVGYRFEVP